MDFDDDFSNNYSTNNNSGEDIHNSTVSASATIQFSENNIYYQDRQNEAQDVEKTMGNLASMFNRLSTMVNQQGHTIERIENNTDSALNNIEMGLEEVVKIKKDVSSNRSLMIKVFLILICVSVLYIIFIG